MTTDKNKNRDDSESRAAASTEEQRLQIAREIHTIAQMVYSRIAVSYPWSPPVPPQPPAQPLGSVYGDWTGEAGPWPATWPW